MVDGMDPRAIDNVLRDDGRVVAEHMKRRDWGRKAVGMAMALSLAATGAALNGCAATGSAPIRTPRPVEPVMVEREIQKVYVDLGNGEKVLCLVLENPGSSDSLWCRDGAYR